MLESIQREFGWITEHFWRLRGEHHPTRETDVLETLGKTCLGAGMRPHCGPRGRLRAFSLLSLPPALFPTILLKRYFLLHLLRVRFSTSPLSELL